MAISKEKLAAIIGGPAKELCQRQLTETHRHNNPSPSDYDYDADYLDSLYYDNGYESSNQSSNTELKYTNESVQNSKLPDYIKESMLKKPIDVSGIDNVSVLSQMVPKQPKKSVKKQITENYEQNTKQTQQIDYSLIKTIVNDCLSNYFNENGFLSKIQLKGGNIIITDNKGETYVAKLEKINKQ